MSISDGRHALSAIPTVHTLVREAHAPKGICSAGEAHLRRRHLEDVRSSPLVGDVGAPEKAGKCLTIIAVANDAAARPGRDAERSPPELSTGAPERNVRRHGCDKLPRILDSDASAALPQSD